MQVKARRHVKPADGKKKKEKKKPEEQMEEKGREAGRRTVTGKRRRQRLRQVRGIKGQRSCDKVCWDSMLTASVPALVNTIPVHFTGHGALCRALKGRSVAVERAFHRRPRKQRAKHVAVLERRRGKSALG